MAAHLKALDEAAHLKALDEAAAEKDATQKAEEGAKPAEPVAEGADAATQPNEEVAVEPAVAETPAELSAPEAEIEPDATPEAAAEAPASEAPAEKPAGEEEEPKPVLIWRQARFDGRKRHGAGKGNPRQQARGRQERDGAQKRGKPHRKDGEKPGFKRKGAPHRPREERPARIDPDSPFAKLAALKDQLKK